MQNNSIPQDDKLILVAVIISAFGIKGELIIKTFIQQPADLLNFSLLDNAGEKVHLNNIRLNSKGHLIGRIEGINTRTEAEKLVKKKIFCPRSSLPALEEESFYIEDLQGLNVVNEEGKQIGQISGIFNYGAGDILEIHFNDKRKELFPFNKKIFPSITKTTILFKG